MLVGFMCTRPAGWAAEDYGSLLGVVGAAAVVLAVSWLVGRRWSSAGVWRAVRIGLTSALLAALAVAAALVVWLAPC